MMRPYKQFPLGFPITEELAQAINDLMNHINDRK